MQSTHYQCSEKHHTFDFLNFAETSRFNNVSSQRAIGVLGCGLPLGYEIIHIGMHQTTTNQLASMFTTALTKPNTKDLIGHELRHKCMITTFDYVIYALALQMLYRLLQIVPIVVGLVRETFYVDKQQLVHVHEDQIVLLS